jgi:hypothetical protein
MEVSMESGSKSPTEFGATTGKKKPLTLLRAFGYSVAVVLGMVGCMALSDYGRSKRSSPEYMAREQQRLNQEVAAKTKKAEEAVQACAKDDIEAFVMSQDHVRSRLKSPSTAKFPTVATPGVTVKYLSSCTHEVHAFVDAQNSFGGTLRSRYTASLQKNPVTGAWHLLRIQIAEP